MEKRRIIFGTYDTALDGLWTLADFKLPTPKYKSNMVDVPGRDGPLDLSTTLTEGEPRYESRTLTVKLESSEGTRLERDARIDDMINELDGLRMDIVLPDRPTQYVTGRVSVSVDYSDMAHAAVTVTAVCGPWRYFKNPRAYTLTAGSTAKTVVLSNVGRRTVVPLLTITGGTVSLFFGSTSWALSDGTYQLPDFAIKRGDVELGYSGSGTIEITYREAVL